MKPKLQNPDVDNRMPEFCRLFCDYRGGPGNFGTNSKRYKEHLASHKHFTNHAYHWEKWIKSLVTPEPHQPAGDEPENQLGEKDDNHPFPDSEETADYEDYHQHDYEDYYEDDHQHDHQSDHQDDVGDVIMDLPPSSGESQEQDDLESQPPPNIRGAALQAQATIDHQRDLEKRQKNANEMEEILQSLGAALDGGPLGLTFPGQFTYIPASPSAQSEDLDPEISHTPDPAPATQCKLSSRFTHHYELIFSLFFFSFLSPLFYSFFFIFLFSFLLQLPSSLRRISFLPAICQRH